MTEIAVDRRGLGELHRRAAVCLQCLVRGAQTRARISAMLGRLESKRKLYIWRISLEELQESNSNLLSNSPSAQTASLAPMLNRLVMERRHGTAQALCPSMHDAVFVVVGTLSNESIGTAGAAAAVVSCLFEGNFVAEALLDDCIRKLLDLFTAVSNPLAIRNAAGALANLLSASAMNISLAAKVGASIINHCGVSALVRLLRPFQKSYEVGLTGGRSYEVAAIAAGALHNLIDASLSAGNHCRLRQVRQQVISNVGVERLLDLLLCGCDEAAANAAGALACLLASRRDKDEELVSWCKIAVRAAGGLLQLVDLLLCPKSSDRVKANAAAALYNVAQDPVNQQTLCEGDEPNQIRRSKLP